MTTDAPPPDLTQAATIYDADAPDDAPSLWHAVTDGRHLDKADPRTWAGTIAFAWIELMRTAGERQRVPQRIRVEALGETFVFDVLPPEAGETTAPKPDVPRRPNRKIAAPSTGLIEMANNGNHGTRNLGLLASDRTLWTPGPTGGWHATIDGTLTGVIELTDEEEFQRLAATISPRAMRTMIGVTQALYERTGHKPFNISVTFTLGEVARAAGYQADSSRHVDPETRLAIAHDLRLLTHIKTYGADGEYNAKSRRWASGWLAPLLNMTAVHLKTDLLGETVPYEFDLMLGRNWATAMEEYDVVQIAPGFRELRGDNVTRLGWFYMTAFRDKMTKARSGVTRSLPALCHESGIAPGAARDRGRFLGQLHRWHKELQDNGVIGSFERRPGADTRDAPVNVWTHGEYMTAPPPAIIQAYAEQRRQALAKSGGRRKLR